MQAFAEVPAFLNFIHQATLQDPDFNKTYVNSGCFIRAHWIAELIQKSGHDPLKVFIEPLTPLKKMHIKLRNEKVVGWVFHVTAGFKDASGEIWVVDPILFLEPVTVSEWLNVIQNQNPGLRILKHVTGPEIYHVDRIENAEFLMYGKPFSDKTMDFIKDGMNILFVWDEFE